MQFIILQIELLFDEKYAKNEKLSKTLAKTVLPAYNREAKKKVMFFR